MKHNRTIVSSTLAFVLAATALFSPAYTAYAQCCGNFGNFLPPVFARFEFGRFHNSQSLSSFQSNTTSSFEFTQNNHSHSFGYDVPVFSPGSFSVGFLPIPNRFGFLDQGVPFVSFNRFGF